MSRADGKEASRLVWWLLGVSTAVVIALLGAWGKGVNDDINSLRSETKDVARIVTLVTTIDRRLSRVEDKLDRILNGEP